MMDMEILVTRRWKTDAGLLGEMSIDGRHECYTIENRALAIKPGRYRLTLTVSDRASKGTLWSPRPDHVLPLLDVPNREGIRIHSGNKATDVTGCIAVGEHTADTDTQPGPDTITESRVELIALMAKLSAISQDAIWVTVKDETA